MNEPRVALQEVHLLFVVNLFDKPKIFIVLINLIAFTAVYLFLVNVQIVAVGAHAELLALASAYAEPDKSMLHPIKIAQIVVFALLLIAAELFHCRQEFTFVENGVARNLW